MKGFFQVLSRANDKNGNSHRLIAVYDKLAFMEKLYYEQTSRPNVICLLVSQNYFEIPSICLSNSEFSTWLKGYKNLLVRM